MQGRLSVIECRRGARLRKRCDMEKAGLEVSVLYVDDEDQSREALARLLRFRGLAVRTAGHGKDALRMFRDERPHIIVTDLMMPEMDGLEMSREIRRICAEIPIIVTSAHLQEKFVVDLKVLGVSHFIQKPVRLERLMNSIETCCLEAGILIRPDSSQ